MKRVHMGKSPESFHSFRDFPKLNDALSFMWAMANVPHGERCWLWQGMDGWMVNSHLAGKTFPTTLEKKIAEFIQEDIEAIREM